MRTAPTFGAVDGATGRDPDLTTGSDPVDSGTWDKILDDLVETLRCAKCGRNYPRASMSFVGARADHQFVRCTCQRCKSEAVAIVIVREIAAGEPDRQRSLSMDDVLDAGEIMRAPTLTLHDLGLV